MHAMIQTMTTFSTEQSANEARSGIAGLDGCFGARVVGAKWPERGFVVQALHEDRPGDLLDGERRAIVPASFLALFTK